MASISSITSTTPYFLLIGAKRAGTTALFEYIMQHPDMQAPPKKELNFLYYKNFDANKYLSLFPRNKLSGEATPNYMIVSECARRIQAVNPKIKIIILLREPVSRILSEYPKQYSRGLTQKTLHTIFIEEKKRLKDKTIMGAIDDLDYFHKFKTESYLLRGHYLHSIKAWQKHFSKKQMYILPSEAMFRNPIERVNDVLKFLELEPLRRYVATSNNSTSDWTKSGVVVPKINSATVKEMGNYFAKYNRKLFEFIGQEFDWVAPANYKPYV